MTSKVLVNAGGPWVNRICEHIQPAPPTIPLQLVQGSHLLLNRPSPGFIYTESLDGRVMFFRPWRDKTLAGTTETPFPYSPESHADPATAKTTKAEINDILATYNHYFPDSSCGKHDIFLTYCGLRALPKSESVAFGTSRETVILTNNDAHPSYLAIYGGKLTTYRKESEKVLKLIQRSINPPKRRSTRDIPL